MSAEPTGAQQLIGDFAPKLVSLTDDVLFGDIWKRPGLSKRDRSLITVTALVALYRTDQLSFHLKRVVENGVTRDELVEADHPPGLLHWLAERDDGDHHCQEALRAGRPAPGHR